MLKRLLTLAALCLLPLAAHADLIKQSSTYQRTVLMTDSADHVTGKTGLTLTVTLSKAGAAYANITPTVTELGAGVYSIALATGNTGTLGALDMHVTATGADPTDTHDQIVAFDPSDAAALGLSSVSGTLTQATGANTQATTAATQATGANTQATTAATQSTTAATNTGTLLTGQGANTTTLSGINTKLGTPAGASLSADIAALPRPVDFWAYSAGSGRTLTGAVTLSLSQALDTSNTTDTVGGGLLAARAQGFGRWAITGTPGTSGSVLRLYAANGTTVLRTFDLSANGSRQ